MLAYCFATTGWGDNEFGAIGDGTQCQKTTHLKPVMASGCVKEGIYYGKPHPTLVSLEPGQSAVQLSALGWNKGNAVCALLTDGDVLCWGANNAHDAGWLLGNPTTLAGWSSNTPVRVVFPEGTPPAVQLARTSGFDNTMCAIVDGGNVWCWGQDRFGVLGNAASAPQKVPVPVEGLPAGTPFVDVSVSEYMACAVTNDGAVYCWGGVSTGASLRLGDAAESPGSRTPVKVALPDDRHATFVRVGHQHARRKQNTFSDIARAIGARAASSAARS